MLRSFSLFLLALPALTASCASYTESVNALESIHQEPAAGPEGPSPAGREPFMQYAFGARPAEELYDIREDPDQLNNLADDATYQGVKKELSEKLMGILEESGDPRVTNDGMTFEKPPDAGDPKGR